MCRTFTFTFTFTVNSCIRPIKYMSCLTHPPFTPTTSIFSFSSKPKFSRLYSYAQDTQTISFHHSLPHLLHYFYFFFQKQCTINCIIHLSKNHKIIKTNHIRNKHTHITLLFTHYQQDRSKKQTLITGYIGDQTIFIKS
jgi:hypothetical protein